MSFNPSKPMKLFYQGFIACLPTMPAYWAVGFACGAIGKISGFSVTEIMLLGIFLYAGSANFLFYALAKTGADTLSIALAVAFINMRYLLINSYMAQFFRHASFFEKLIGGILMTDETFGIAARYAQNHDHYLPFPWLFGLNGSAWINWVLAIIAGCFLTAFLPAGLYEALAFSLVGMFVALLLLGWFASSTPLLDVIVASLTVIFILCSYPIFNNTSLMILAPTSAATMGVLLYFWKLQKKKSQKKL